MLALLKAFTVLAPAVKSIVVEIVKALGKLDAEAQRDAAGRFLDEARHMADFEREIMKRRG